MTNLTVEQATEILKNAMLKYDETFASREYDESFATLRHDAGVAGMTEDEFAELNLKLYIASKMNEIAHLALDAEQYHYEFFSAPERAVLNDDEEYLFHILPTVYYVISKRDATVSIAKEF